MLDPKPSARRPLATTRTGRPLQPALLALGFVILICISAASLWLVQRSADDARDVGHTLELQNKLSTLLLHLRRAESAQRGYLITGQRIYLDRYRDSIATAGPVLAETQAMTAADPRQQDALAEIETLLAQKRAEMQRTIELYEAGDREAAFALVRSGEGADSMERIRDIVETAIVAQRGLLQQQASASRQTSLWLLAITLAGAALIALIGGLSVFLIQRSSRQREDAQRALEAANAGLEQTVAERTAHLREANNEIQRFAYIVSHDLRSPLVNIMGFTAELEALRADAFARIEALRGETDAAREKDEILARDFEEALGFIKSATGKMDRLINSILKLSREGRRRFRPEFVNVAELLRDIIKAHAHDAAESGAEIEIEELPPIYSDRLALEQIFSNLIDNALKYLHPGRPGRIVLRGRSAAAMVIYEIEDNGRGVAAEDHERIFELFRRAGPQDRPGDGIGLAHVRALTRRLGGQMTLRSAPGRGSTFVIALPRRFRDDDLNRETTGSRKALA